MLNEKQKNLENIQALFRVEQKMLGEKRWMYKFAIHITWCEPYSTSNIRNLRAPSRSTCIKMKSVSIANVDQAIYKYRKFRAAAPLCSSGRPERRCRGINDVQKTYRNPWNRPTSWRVWTIYVKQWKTKTNAAHLIFTKEHLDVSQLVRYSQDRFTITPSE